MAGSGELAGDASLWDASAVAVWVSEQIEETNYANVFMRNHISGVELKELTDQDLRESLGIASLGHRKKLLRAIQQL